MMLLGKTIGRLQIGVMVGMHSKSLVAAISSGNWDKIYGALVNAAFDSALVAVTVKAGSHPVGGPGEEPEPGREPAPQSLVRTPGPGSPAPASPAAEPGPGPWPASPRRRERATPAGNDGAHQPRAGTPAAATSSGRRTDGGRARAPGGTPAPTGPKIDKPGIYTNLPA